MNANSGGAEITFAPHNVRSFVHTCVWHIVRPFVNPAPPLFRHVWGSHMCVAVRAECLACRNGVAIFDQSYFGNWTLSGPDALTAVQYLCSSDFSKKQVGTVTYTTLCNSRGGVEADLTVARLAEDRFYFSAGGQTRSKDRWWIERILEGRGLDVELLEESDEVSILSIQGPHSKRMLEGIFAGAGDLDMEFSSARFLNVGGKDVLVMRLTFVGELGFELHCKVGDAGELYEIIKAAGVEYRNRVGVPVLDAGYRAIDSLSAEKGYRHYHADLSNSDTPMEAGIGFTALPKLKGWVDFLGREALQVSHTARRKFNQQTHANEGGGDVNRAANKRGSKRTVQNAVT